MTRLVQITDCHLFADTEKFGYGDVNPYFSLQKVLEKVVCEVPDIVLVTGDISGDLSEKSYQLFKELWQQSSCQAQLAVIPGNHDSEQNLNDVFGELELSASSGILVGNWQIHGANTHYRGTLGKLSEQDLLQLELTIKYAPDINHLIAVHHHPIVTGGWMDRHEWLNADAFVEMLSHYPQVRAVVYGHIHQESEVSKNGCRYLACPSTCWQYTSTADFSVCDSSPGYRILDLAEDGRFETRIVRL